MLMSSYLWSQEVEFLRVGEEEIHDASIQIEIRCKWFPAQQQGM